MQDIKIRPSGRVVGGWAVAGALTVFYGFVLPGSDTAAGALSLFVLVAVVAAAAWTWPIPEQPALLNRVAVRWVLVAALLLAAILSVLPLMSFVTGKAGGYGGLYDPSSAWLEYIKLAGVCCAFCLGFRIAMSYDAARKALDALLIMGGVWAFVCIVMHILDPDGIYGVMKMGSGRLTGAFSSPNSAGTLFGALSVLALGRTLGRFRALKGRPLIERIDLLFVTIWLLSLAALILSLSRGAIAATLLATAIMLFLLFLSGRRRRFSVRAAGITGIGVGILLVGVFATPLSAVMDRMYQLETDFAARAQIFSSHYEVAIRQPFFGFGLGSFNAVNETIISEANYRDLSVIRAAHNVYLQWLEETGLIGLAGLILLNLSILVPMLRAIWRQDRAGGHLTAIVGAYLVFILHGLTDYAFQESALTVFVALMLGCGLAIASNQNTTRPH